MNEPSISFLSPPPSLSRPQTYSLTPLPHLFLTGTETEVGETLSELTPGHIAHVMPAGGNVPTHIYLEGTVNYHSQH